MHKISLYIKLKQTRMLSLKLVINKNTVPIQNKLFKTPQEYQSTS